MDVEEYTQKLLDEAVEISVGSGVTLFEEDTQAQDVAYVLVATIECLIRDLVAQGSLSIGEK